jgi:methanogenic corrinoid protein MtbC1
MRYLLKILEGDCGAAIKMILDEREHGLSLEESYQTLILAQCEVGKMWHQAEVSIAEEHLVTSTTKRAMAILAHLAVKQGSNGLTLVSAAVHDNAHDIGIRVVSDFFEFAGWRVVCLGSNLPANEVVGAVNSFDASLVLLSATMSIHLKAVRQAIDEIRTASDTCRIMVGGPAFRDAPDLWRQLGADAYAATPAEAVTIASQLMEAR